MALVRLLEYARLTEQAVVLSRRMCFGRYCRRRLSLALQGLRTRPHSAGTEGIGRCASGGVGTFATQITKSFEPEVTGVLQHRQCRRGVRDQTDDVIDYAQEDFATNGRQYDLIFDIVANRPIADYLHALTPAEATLPARLTRLRCFRPFIYYENRSARHCIEPQTKSGRLMFVQRLLEEARSSHHRSLLPAG